MLKTIIIEDDPFQMEIISDLLETSFPSVKIVSKAMNAEDGIREVSSLKPDLVFLDIDLPDKSGFEVLQELPDHFFDFIFVTAHEKFALQSYRYDAIGFLLKPITRESMQQALNKLARKRKNEYSVEHVQEIIEDMKNTYDNQQKISVPSLKMINYIRIMEISRMEADGNYTTIVLTNGKSLVSSKQIGDYEKQLAKNKFFRVHDKHLINLRFVKSFMKGESSSVEMEGGFQVPVSRRRKEDLLQVLEGLFA